MLFTLTLKNFIIILGFNLFYIFKIIIKLLELYIYIKVLFLFKIQKFIIFLIFQFIYLIMIIQSNSFIIIHKYFLFLIS